MILRIKIFFIIASLSIIFSQKSFSHTNDPRHMAMVTLAKNMQEISRVIKSKSPLSSDNLKKLEQVYEISKKIDTLFDEDDSDKKGSRASPEIWKNKDKFMALTVDFEKSVENLIEVVKSNDNEEMISAISSVGASCGKCHRSFRLPKKN
ncbi:MAG: hypothetical protein CFH01_00623 [Alphaproteobacteria bacterium MarineAlpha2_Bin1]|nr:MAG: hypothetical protein CFH01_00623 [Alphaproteobacteria bacterium MarineAlpha2_Bin1]|tara:strand:+ start:562 stop:1011 length:450 start_codon:yes stop_codon:yes gene_type:complete